MEFLFYMNDQVAQVSCEHKSTRSFPTMSIRYRFWNWGWIDELTGLNWSSID